MKPLGQFLQIPDDVEYEDLGVCPDCNKKTFLYDGVKVGCQCELVKESYEQINKQKALGFAKNSIMSKTHKEKRLNDYKPENNSQDRAKNTAVDYIVNFDEHLKNGKNLILQGTMGTGKTHIAASIRNALVERNYKVFFISFPEYMDMLKMSFDDPNKQHNTKRMINECELLVIDDIGANRLTGFAIDELFKITDARIGACTIYTTNMSAKDLEGSIDIKRAFSRMLENTEVITLDGEDYRRKRNDN